MSCTQSQLVLLLEYLERRVENKMKKLNIPKDKIHETILEIEKVKQSIIEYGLAEIERELGI